MEWIRNEIERRIVYAKSKLPDKYYLDVQATNDYYQGYVDALGELMEEIEDDANTELQVKSTKD